MPRNLIPLDWDEDAVRLLAMIAPEDADQAQVWWETYAPLAYQAILDAGFLADRDDLPRDDEEFERWLAEQVDQKNQERKRRWWALGIFFFFVGWRYITMTNITVPDRTVRGVLDRTLANNRRDARALCDSLLSGNISVADWQTQMVGMISNLHLSSAVLAKGGFGRMSQDDYLRVSGLINDQLDYLANFANQIYSGQQRLDGTVCRRMQLYIEAGRETYHIVEAELMEDRGYDEYRNVLGLAEHCGECVSETDRGWVPIGTLVPIGSRECGNNCKCTYEYRMSDET